MSRRPMSRRLWIDTRGQPVITSTRNGEQNAKRWGWTEAVVVTAADRPSVTDNADVDGFLDWLIRMDEPRNEDRRTVTLTQIIAKAVAVREAEGRAETTTATPPGLTVSEDGSVLNWQGVNYVPQRAETTTEAVERIARQIARETAMTGRDALELVEAVQALQDAETTTATDEDAARVINEVLGGDMDNHARIAAHRLADAGLLATARTRPTREQIIDALVMSPLSDTAGTDMRPFEQTADAVLALFRGGA